MPRPAPILAAALIALAAWLAWPLSAVDAVRRSVSDTVTSFDEAAIRAVLDGFDTRFVDESGPQRIDRETIRLGLLAAARSGLQPRSWQLRLDPVILVPHCDEDVGRADASFVVRVFDIDARAEHLRDQDLRWAVAVDAELSRGEDGRWRFVRSTHRTLSGRPPYR